MLLYCEVMQSANVRSFSLSTLRQTGSAGFKNPWPACTDASKTPLRGKNEKEQAIYLAEDSEKWLSQCLYDCQCGAAVVQKEELCCVQGVLVLCLLTAPRSECVWDDDLSWVCVCCQPSIWFMQRSVQASSFWGQSKNKTALLSVWWNMHYHQGILFALACQCSATSENI